MGQQLNDRATAGGDGRPASPPHSEEQAPSYTLSSLGEQTPSEVAKDIAECPAHWASPRSQALVINGGHEAGSADGQASGSPPGAYGGVVTRTPPLLNKNDNQSLSITQQGGEGGVVIRTPPGQDTYVWQEGHQYQRYRDRLNEQRKLDYNRQLKVPPAQNPSVYMILWHLARC